MYRLAVLLLFVLYERHTAPMEYCRRTIRVDGVIYYMRCQEVKYHISKCKKVTVSLVKQISLKGQVKIYTKL